MYSQTRSTSAAGARRHGHLASEQFGGRLSAGFTLIEIMVVMVIIGMMAGMISLVAAGNQERRELENTARELMAVLQTASDEAVLQNLELAVEFRDEGLRFRAFDEETRQWTTLPDPVLADRPFPEHVEIDYSGLGPGFQLKAAPSAEFSLPDELGAAEEQSESAPFLPQILLLSGGDMTPFTLHLRSRSVADLQYTLLADGLNPIQLQVPADEEERE